MVNLVRYIRTYYLSEVIQTSGFETVQVNSDWYYTQIYSDKVEIEQIDTFIHNVTGCRIMHIEQDNTWYVWNDEKSRYIGVFTDDENG